MLNSRTSLLSTNRTQNMSGTIISGTAVGLNTRETSSRSVISKLSKKHTKARGLVSSADAVSFKTPNGYLSP